MELSLQLILKMKVGSRKVHITLHLKITELIMREEENVEEGIVNIMAL